MHCFRRTSRVPRRPAGSRTWRTTRSASCRRSPIRLCTSIWAGTEAVAGRLINRRLRLLLVFFVLAFGATFARVVWLQVVRAGPLSRMAARQHREVVPIPAGRGTIFDHLGVQLALGEQATTVYADPRQVQNARAVALAAQQTLGVSANGLYPLLLERERSFVYIARKADPKRAAALEKLGLAGLGFYPEERRFYPQHAVASQVLGYAGVDNRGLAGVELGLDRLLTGRPGKQTIVKDPLGRVLDVVSSTAEREGRSVSLTLDHSIQATARVIHDAEPRPTETMTVGEIVSRSSNVGAITLAKLLGPERLGRWIGRFGFGRLTGIDFPGESPGIVLPVPRWSGSTIGNVPIGQGIAVTPIQMAAAYASVANRGVWVEPHLVDHFGDGSKPRVAHRRIVSSHVAHELIAMLENVVVEGTGELAQVAGYNVAGKTGTAAKPDGLGGYSASRYVASFVGVVPASAQRLLVLVLVDEPQGQIFGGLVAAPAFEQIAHFDLQYLEVPPDNPSTLATSSATAAAASTT